MFICKYMYFPTWVFCFVFCGNLQRLLYNMSKQGCFFINSVTTGNAMNIQKSDLTTKKRGTPS